MSDFADFIATSQDNQLWYIYQSANGTATSFNDFISTTRDEQLWLVYNAILNSGSTAPKNYYLFKSPSGYVWQVSIDDEGSLTQTRIS